MVNMLLLTRLRLPNRRPITGSGRFNNETLHSGVCKAPLCRKAAETATHGLACSQTEGVYKGLGLIQPSPGDSQQASTRNGMYANNQMKTLIGGLYGNGRQAISAFLKQNLGLLSSNCCGWHVVPVRHFRSEYVTDSRGVTFPCVLSTTDQDLVRAEASKLLAKELKKLNITFFAQIDAKKTFSDRGLFGTALHVMAEKDLNAGLISPQLPIPYIFQWMMRYIYVNAKEAEDIFEKPEASTKVAKLKDVLKSRFPADPKNFKLGNEFNVYDVAAALKALIDELELPLISSDGFPSFPNIPQEKPSYRTNIRVLPVFIMTMRSEHRDTLQLLITLFNSTKPYRHKNETLSKIFGPLLFKKPIENPKVEPWFHKLTRDLITSNDGMFEVPQSIMKAIRRHRTENKMDAKPMNFERQTNLPPRMLIDMKGKCLEVCLAELSNAQILVNAPSLLCSKKIPVTSETTAEEIISTVSEGTRSVGHYINDFKAEVLTPKDPKANDSADPLHLYEVGGNIDERCLHPITNMLEVYKANPSAEFWIKTWQKNVPKVTS
ncbi:unnamed protein product [Lymnaea stagnalis]|uniref:Rho-GAP domain-containing protein n=1 Tax=Lymnaea stagnalis TaxID=6523 RepID=A0AAV2HGG9_LYMST